MARLRTLTKVSMDHRKHTEVDAEWAIVQGDDGVLFQVNTFGSDSRKLKRQMSQSVQVDRAMAAELIKALRQTFPGL